MMTNCAFRRWNDRENRRVPSASITCVPSVYATLIEKQSVGVFAQYFYDIFGVPGSVLGVQPYKHRLTVHLPTTARSMH